MCFSKHIFRIKETYRFMALATSLVVLFYCHATADDKTSTAMLLVFSSAEPKAHR